MPAFERTSKWHRVSGIYYVWNNVRGSLENGVLSCRKGKGFETHNDVVNMELRRQQQFVTYSRNSRRILQTSSVSVFADQRGPNGRSRAR